MLQRKHLQYMGTRTLIIRQHIKDVKYWCRILKLSQSHPVRNAYNMLLQLEPLASRIGVTVFALFSNKPGFIKLGNCRILGIQINSCFKESIVRIFTQRWRKDIESSNKLRTYALVKQYFCVEPYISHIRGNHLITAMVRYRMSSHDLNIERGRFNNPINPKNQQICTRCELNEINDEIHLLLHCSAMNNERKILFDSVAAIINIQQTNEMLPRIMTSRDITVVESLAQFIYCCFKQIKG